MTGARTTLVALALGALAATPGSTADEPETSTVWSYAVPGHGPLQLDLPADWDEMARDDASHSIRFRSIGGERCEMVLAVAWSPTPDPGFNGPDAVRAVVERQGADLLDQIAESHVGLRELRGPQSGGYYFQVRDRAPKKRWAVVITRGAIGVGDLLVRFTVLTPQPKVARIRQALNMIAGSRQGPAREPPPAAAPAPRTPAETEAGSGTSGER